MQPFLAALLNNQDVNKMQPFFPFGETSERVRRELALLRVRIAHSEFVLPTVDGKMIRRF